MFPTCQWSLLCKEQDLFTLIHLDNAWVLFFTNLLGYTNPSNAWAGPVYTTPKHSQSSYLPSLIKCIPESSVCIWRWSWESHHVGCMTIMKLFNNFLAFQRNSQDCFNRKLANFFCWVTTGVKFSSQSVLYNLWSQPGIMASSASHSCHDYNFFSSELWCSIICKTFHFFLRDGLESNLGSSVCLITRAHLCQSDVLHA